MILTVAGGQTTEKTYLTALQEDILPLFEKAVGDRSANPRREAAEFCGAIVKHRVQSACWFDSNATSSGNGATVAFGGNREASAPPLGLDSSLSSVDLDTELFSVLIILMGDDDENVRKTSMKVGESLFSIIIIIGGGVNMSLDI